MEIKRGPILTSHEIRRAAAMGVTNPNIHIAQVGTHTARLVADLEYTQQTPRGIESVPVNADFFATGGNGSFSGRGLKAEITSRDKSIPFSYAFDVEETPTGIAYAVRRINGSDLSRTYNDTRQTDYCFLELLAKPRQITPEDLVQIDHDQTLALNQIMTAAILKATGAPLLETRSDQ